MKKLICKLYLRSRQPLRAPPSSADWILFMDPAFSALPSRFFNPMAIARAPANFQSFRVRG